MIPLDAVSLGDRGLLLGDGLFETLLAIDGTLQDLDAHLNRLAESCVVFGLPAPDPAESQVAMIEALAEAALSIGRAAVRLTLTAGDGGRGLDRPAEPSPVLFAIAAPAPLWTKPARLATAKTRRNEGSLAARLKTLSYADNVLARREAMAVGADEALMLNNGDKIAGCAAANLFWIEGDSLCTPALDCGVLAGTMRANVMARARRAGLAVREAHFGLDSLAKATGVFLTNSLVGVRPVDSLDGQALAPPSQALLAALS